MLSLLLLLASGASQQETTEAIPRGNPADWVRYEDLPADAVREAKRDVLTLQIAVTASGTPAKCNIMETSGSRRLDDAVCEQLMANGRFQPARDSAGAPISGTLASRIHLAQSSSRTAAEFPGLSYESEFEYRVDRDGKATGCRSIRPVGIAPIKCVDALGKRVMTPPNDGSFNGGTMTIRTTRTFEPD
jgi:hypothetical protein